jgi:hypothetical protein
MSERNEENDEANGQAIRARADLRYLARTSPPIPENAGGAQANRGDKGNSRQRISLGGHYRAEANLALECMVTLCLAGPEAEREFCGPITESSDRVDYEMAHEYLARQLNPLQVGAEFSRYRDAAQRLVRAFGCSPTPCCGVAR